MVKQFSGRIVRQVALALCFAATYLSLGATIASAHTVFYSIGFYPVQYWTGDSQHYKKAPFAPPGSPDDYLITLNAQVRQTVGGSFDWISFKTGGADLAGRGYKGTL